MSYINFVIPQDKSELLSDSDDKYFVKNVVGIKEIHSKLKEAKLCLKDEGPEFILENFDTYFSVLHYGDSLQLDVLFKAYEDLHKAVHDLNKALGFLLEDKDNLNDNEELITKYLNVIKMLMYVYTKLVTMIDLKIETKRSQTLQVKRDINIFWDPPIVEEVFVNLVADVCYRFLEIPSIKSDKEVRTEIFNVYGTLLKNYNHGMTFVVRIVQFLKLNEHLVHCLPEGIQMLVQNYNCKSLMRDFVREVTEWQVDEKFDDSQGTRNCAGVLSEMATLMPSQMIPEVMYLTRYLAHDSYALRNSVLNVITEVIQTVLTKDDLTEEERESRDEFLAILEEHIDDVSAHVRSRVFQHWARLHKENAIPLKIQTNILEKSVMHLKDKAANVRKSAAHCVGIFLSHNIYGASLQLAPMEKELAEKTEILNGLKAKFGQNNEKLRELEQQWKERESDIRVVIKQKIDTITQESNEEDFEIHKDNMPEMVVRTYVLDGKYAEAFAVCKKAGHQFAEWKERRANMDEEEEVTLFLTLLHAIFLDVSKRTSEAANENGNMVAPTEDDIKQLENMEITVGYLNDAVSYLKLINEAIIPMKDLLESASVGDMHEAVEFFVAAYQFNIENAMEGILEMLRIMQRNEQERKDVIINAFKTIYLTTDSDNMRDHTTIIVNRLISLLQTVPFDNLQDLTGIISEWVSKGILDNGVIDTLWQYFTKKIEVSDESSRAALHILMMASMGRRTIITRNIKLVSAVAFGERGKEDLLLVSGACQILAVAGSERQTMTDKNPPFKVKAADPIWSDISDILVDSFHSKSPFYNSVTAAAVDLVFRLCSQPHNICERLIEKTADIILKQVKDDVKEFDRHVVAQCLHLLGVIAVKNLNYLDETVYKELKRRNYIREERKATKKGKDARRPKVNNSTSAIKSLSMSNNASGVNDSTATQNDESTLEGAQADDTDAEFILNVLENGTVTGSNGLGKLAPLIIKVCERPDFYDDLYIQGCAVTALLRFMIVSSKFCQQHMQLVFTILEKTMYSEIKCSILIHCSDLLERFPNIVEPWTPRLYERLCDPIFEVRRSAFFMLANLILRDMIRVQGYISGMARCIVDGEEQLKSMSKNFFAQLSRKANNLYNILPDIFSHLSDDKDLAEEDLRHIMKFMFCLIDKNKQMENLVDRFCSKFKLTEDNYKCCNIAYCLSLIQYNDKGLRRLLDNFDSYKHLMLNNDVYSIFKQILAACGRSMKNEIKAIATEIDEKIQTVFDMDENEQQSDGALGSGTPRANRVAPGSGTPQSKRVVQAGNKSAFKKPKGRAPKRKKVQKMSDSDESSSEEENKENQNQNQQQSRRKRAQRKRNNRKKVDSSSDESSSD